MIDIHCHLLPGVDDGSPAIEATLPVLERFAAEGVEVLVCTPHLRASEAVTIDDARYAAIFEDLVSNARRSPKLERGWEIMLDVPEADLRPAHLGLAGSTARLVEFPRMNVPAGASRELFRLRMSGVVPVLAHPERYWGATTQLVLEWRNAGAAIQLDSAMVLSGGGTGKLARALLEEGLVDCIASDNHGDVRSLGVARRWLEELGATEQAQLLTSTNAGRLLAGEAVIPVSPLVPIEKGMVSRFKELLLGRR